MAECTKKIEEEVELPQPVRRPFAPFDVTIQGWWLVLSDLHIPFHDPKVISLAVKEGLRYKLKGVLLNGDVMDCHELSSFDRDPTLPRYREEVKDTRKFLKWLRSRCPDQLIIFKAGNHEERLERYVMRRAEALFGLEEVTLPSILHLNDYGVGFVGDKRVVHMNKLSVIHGHEYRPAVQTPVNPARGLFLRAKASAMCGHWHQTSEHHEPTITGKPIGCWSTGCLCDLHPAYSPLNKWNAGFALVNLVKNEEFEIRNLRILHGRVI